MQSANQIVSSLLEEEPPVESDDFDVARHVSNFGKDVESGKVTAYSLASRFWHRTKTYAGGVRALEVRRNGKTQTWKRQPGKFRIPCKYGMYEYFDITDANADEFTTVQPADKPKPVKQKLK